MILLAARARVSGGGDPSIVPIPIGPGPRYRPAAIARDGAPVGTLRCGPPGKTFRVHSSSSRRGASSSCRSGIGVARSGCVYPARTLRPTGVVEVAPGAKLRSATSSASGAAGSGRNRLLSFRSAAAGAAYVARQALRRAAGSDPADAGRADRGRDRRATCRRTDLPLPTEEVAS